MNDREARGLEIEGVRYDDRQSALLRLRGLDQ